MVKNDKLERLQQQLTDGQAVLLCNTSLVDPNMLYFLQCSMEAAFLVVLRKKSYLFVSTLEEEKARATMAVDEIVVYQKGAADLKNVFTSCKEILVNKSFLNVAFFEKLQKEFSVSWGDCSELLRSLRMIKDKNEVLRMKKACQISGKIFREMLKHFSSFKTEKDAACFIERVALYEASGVSFPTIVASGEHSSQPHYATQNTKLLHGFCVIDFGVRFEGYISDITRTLFLGKPSKQELGDYQLVVDANKRCIAALREGIAFSKLDALSRKKHEYCHSLGHGIGVEVHEAPRVNKKSTEVLRNGMCFTIEPGLYKPGKYGIRIEDDIYFHRQAEVLSKGIPKELIVLG